MSGTFVLLYLAVAAMCAFSVTKHQWGLAVFAAFIALLVLAWGVIESVKP